MPCSVPSMRERDDRTLGGGPPAIGIERGLRFVAAGHGPYELLRHLLGPIVIDARGPAARIAHERVAVVCATGA